MIRFVPLAVGLILCAAPALADEAGISPTEVKIGMVNAQTGTAAALGKALKTGAEAVFSSIKRQGGIHGRTPKLVVGDDGYNPSKTIDSTLKLIEEDNVFALIEFAGSPQVHAALPVLKDTEVPLVGTFCGSSKTRQPVIPNVCDIRASYDEETEVDHLIKELGAKKIAVFTQDDSFMTPASLEAALKRRGMTTYAKATFKHGTLAVDAGVAQLLEAKPDVICMVGPAAPLAAFTKAARAAGITAQLVTVLVVGAEDYVRPSARPATAWSSPR